MDVLIKHFLVDLSPNIVLLWSHDQSQNNEKLKIKLSITFDLSLEAWWSCLFLFWRSVEKCGKGAKSPPPPQYKKG